AAEPQATAHAIDWQSVGPDELGEGPRSDALQQPELEGAILGVAEAQAKPGIAGASRVDVGDSPAIAPDGQRRIDPRHADPTAHHGQPATDEAEEHAGPSETGHRDGKPTRSLAPQARTYTRRVSRT